MAQPPYQGYAYPPQQGYPPYQPQQQIYVQPQQKSSSETLAKGVGGAFASMVHSGNDLVKGSGKAAKSGSQSVGNAAAGIVKSGGQLLGSTAKGYTDERDRLAQSPLLSCFAAGSGIQLLSKAGKGCLRCLPNGMLDGRGTLGQDYSCHWLVVHSFENKVILRNGAFPQFHLANAVGQTVATGVGDAASSFKLHETSNHYITLEHEMSKQYAGIDFQQNLVPAANVTRSGENSMFEVHLVYSPIGHTYMPVH